MTETIPIGKTRKIGECGFDESWLQDQIHKHPGCLGLGENLQAVAKELPQPGGGRLDLLLEDPEDDSFYEVEVMLGETDPSHIMRIIEYWDNEKRRRPTHRHYAVVVAESVTSRFFNVIQLIGRSVPFIAVQANFYENDPQGQRVLCFTKVLDVYEDQGEGLPDPPAPATEAEWRAKAPWSWEAATALLETVRSIHGKSSLKPRQDAIGVRVGPYNYYLLRKLSNGKSSLEFWLSDELFEKARGLLDGNGLPFQRSKDRVKLTVDKTAIASHADMFREIAELVKKYREG